MNFLLGGLYMATIRKSLAQQEPIWLRNGQHMLRKEFHRAFCKMPGSYRAELIGGVVFEPSPVSSTRSDGHVNLIYLLETYARATPGTRTTVDATVMLSDEDEVQPDLTLRILTEY